MFKTLFSASVLTVALVASASTEAGQERLRRTADYELALKGHEPRGVPAEVVRASANYSATTTGAPTYNRAFADCSGLSGVGVGVNFHVQEFHVGTTGAHDVTSTQTGGWDGFIFVYENAFNPAAALTNCFAGNDDAVAGIGFSEILGVNLNSATTYFLVTTGFEPGEDGAFTNTISGPGSITIGPAGPQADLSIVKTAPSGVVTGANFTYALTAANAGPVDATAVVVTDVLPAGVNFVSSTCGATNAAGTVTWNIGALTNGANQSCTLTVALAGASCVSVSNTATIAGAEGDPSSANNSSTSSNGGGPGGNIILDPSFEDGTPNSFWAETSTNFGTPLCDVAGCGTGTGTGPRTGTFWAWFGGVAAVETGSLEQSVVIPTGSTAITFFREYPICANATDFVRLLIDGTEVWREDGTSPRCNTVGYQQVSVALTAGQANGASHLIRFDSTISGAPSGSNFFIDDVELLSPPTTPVCGTAPGALTLSPLSIDFASVEVGTSSAPLPLTLTNSGAGALQVTAIGAAAAPFAQTGGTCAAVPFTLTAGASCTVEYTFNPTAIGPFSQPIAVTSDGGGGTATLSGTGIAGFVSRPVPALGLGGTLMLLMLLGLGSVLVIRRTN
jgi:uncharacterized repeat protein (TIGR01451 family)